MSIKKILISLLVLTFVTPVLVIVYAFQSFKIKARGEIINSPSNFIEIPYRYNETGHIVIIAKINGQSFPFIIDSGASNMIFAGNGLRYDRFKGFGFGIDSNGEFVLSRMGSVGSVEIGDMVFSDLRFEMIESDISGCQESGVGIIGKETMRKAIWQFFPNRKMIRIAMNQSAVQHSASEDTIRLRINPYGHQPSANISLDGRPTRRYLMDTGFNGNITTSLDSSWNLTKGIRVIGTASKGLMSKDSTDNYLFEIDQLRIKQFVIDKPITVSVSDRSFQALGLGILADFNFTFDWKNQVLLLDPLPKQSFKSKSYGVRLETADDGVVVSTLYVGMQAFHSGLYVNQRIEEINGYPANTISDDCILDDLIDDRDTLVLKYRDGEHLKTIELRKEYFFEPTNHEDLAKTLIDV